MWTVVGIVFLGGTKKTIPGFEHEAQNTKGSVSAYAFFFLSLFFFLASFEIEKKLNKK